MAPNAVGEFINVVDSDPVKHLGAYYLGGHLQGVSKQQYFAKFPSSGHNDVVECCDLLSIR